MRVYTVDSIGRISLRNVSQKTLDKYYFRAPSKVYVYRKARYVYNPLEGKFSWVGAKRANRRSGRKAYLYIRSEPSRPPEPLMEVVVQGNAVRKETNETGKDVYFEGYIPAEYTEEEVVNRVMEELQNERIKLFRTDNTDKISVNFVDRPKGSKPVYSLDGFAVAVRDAVGSSMHPAKPYSGSHHGKRERITHNQYRAEWEGI